MPSPRLTKQTKKKKLPPPLSLPPLALPHGLDRCAKGAPVQRGDRHRDRRRRQKWRRVFLCLIMRVIKDGEPEDYTHFPGLTGAKC